MAIISQYIVRRRWYISRAIRKGPPILLAISQQKKAVCVRATRRELKERTGPSPQLRADYDLYHLP